MTETHPPAPSQDPQSRPKQRSKLLGGVADYVQQLGRDVISVIMGKLIETPEPHRGPEESQLAEPKPPPPADSTTRRVRALHEVAERLRGATDSYITAKLDEIEARVDAKLDNLEDYATEVSLEEAEERIKLLLNKESKGRAVVKIADDS